MSRTASMYLELLHIVFVIQQIDLKIIPDIYELSGCPGHDYHMDFSDVEFSYDDDGYLTVNGNFTFLRDVVAPYPAYIYSERLEQGEWRPAIITKSVPDFCAVIQNPMEVWYPVTRQLNKKNCPYKAGFVGRIDNVRYSFPVPITPNFLGEWRVFLEQRDITKETEEYACLVQYFSVIDI
ncbi:uncharacterized protein LOC110676929 [Aedes aegypti]|uniref:Uncharacterized protein n=1 Tax=Aedes aegypti TaxID=7159 RepID=A0A6I8U8H0_AEDAE|nr:uncharacterized protein LOC110676929 [Aedes aegypti]